MKRILLAILVCVGLSVASGLEAKSAPCQINPVSLTCEKMASPNCIDILQPRLSWINAPADDSVKGARQSAYRIRVASSREGLAKADLWDSRKVKSDQSVFVPYGGEALVSGQQVWWQVKVWDGKGKASDWSEPAQWRMGVMNPDEWTAKWIGAPWQQEWESRNTTPAPYFRKVVNLDKKVASAVAFVTGLGYFEFYVNGNKIGDEVLVPNFTNYSKRPHLPKVGIAIEDNFRGYRVMYLTYDITESLKQGKNAIGMIVGNGWYNTHTWHWPASYGSPRMLCQVKVTYEDGSEEIIVSDESWKVKESAIVYNDEYAGETYDARQEISDWCSVGCDEASWKNAVLREAPTGELCASYAPLDRVVETLRPVSFEKTEKGWEVDFGKEISGWLRFDGVKAASGDVLQVKYVSESPVGTQKYIFGQGECRDYAPKFAWYVFRKAIITGVELSEENVVAEVVNTDVKADAEFATSNPLLNQINTIWRRSLEDNLHGGVMSDCPHREKSPYTGDGQVCCETVMSNYDCYTFYHKWLRDMRDAQNVETGHVPNSAPWQPGCGGGVGWGAAVNIIPWEMYRHFGDVQLLEESYFTMTEQMRFMMKYITEEGIMDCKNEIVNGDHRFDRWLRLGEWVAPHGLPANHLVHTYFLWRCADITSKAAGVLGKTDDEKKYREVAESVKAAFHKKYYDPQTKSYGDYGANVFALHMGVPEEYRKEVVEAFRVELTDKYGKHLNTGIFGTRRLFEVLAQNGLNELAYEIINQKDYPSFGWWLEQGATTTWENWNGKNSRNHPMFGGGLTWFYNTLAGVNVDESQPGYRHVVVRPSLLKDLTNVCYSKMTPYGLLKVEISHEDFNGQMRVTVPVGTTATVYVPHSCAPQSLSQGTYTLKFCEKMVMMNTWGDCSRDSKVDEKSCQSDALVYRDASAPVDKRVEDLLKRMTLEEKLLQLNQYTIGHNTVENNLGEAVRDIPSEIGSLIYFGDDAKLRNIMQKKAMEESRLGIPILFGHDVIHGYRTIFPIPLAQACSWNPELARKSSAVAAREAASSGVDWTFSPMVDVARDPRWGRVMEGYGEDVYTNSVFCEAAVRGYQGDDLSDPNSIAACLKHYVGYGASEAGRDYVPTEISDQTLWDTYLPPFEAGVKAGAVTLMSAFHNISGTPASANRYILTEILKEKWGHDGFVVSDWDAVRQLINQGMAKDGKEAAMLAFNAGIEMDMVDDLYLKYIPELLDEGHVSIKQVDEAVRRVLRVKFRLGLFDRPYTDERPESERYLLPESLVLAEKLAVESMVLLKNEGGILPLDGNARIALIGPFAEAKSDHMGGWAARGRVEDVVSISEAMSAEFHGNVIVAEGCAFDGNDRSCFAEAVRAVRSSDVAVVCIGLKGNWSGENCSRSTIELPQIQIDLLEAVAATGKPVVVVNSSGRPVDLHLVEPLADAVMQIWHPGVRAGNAVAGLLSGRYNPSGKLAMTFPYNTGQIPIYYNRRNSGRRGTQGLYKDVQSAPLYEFGHGLSYSEFEYGELKVSKDTLSMDETITAEISVKNLSGRDGMEVVHWYVCDPYSHITRPVKELKFFEKKMIKAGGEEVFRFEIDPMSDLGFVDRTGRRYLDKGEYQIIVGKQKVTIEVI